MTGTVERWALVRRIDAVDAAAEIRDTVARFTPADRQWILDESAAMYAQPQYRWHRAAFAFLVWQGADRAASATIRAGRDRSPFVVGENAATAV